MMRDKKLSFQPETRHHKREMILCISLHIGLVLMHAALFVVYSHHYEWSISMRIDSLTTTWAPLAVGTVLQTFGTVSAAALVSP